MSVFSRFCCFLLVLSVSLSLSLSWHVMVPIVYFGVQFKLNPDRLSSADQDSFSLETQRGALERSPGVFGTCLTGTINSFFFFFLLLLFLFLLPKDCNLCPPPPHFRFVQFDAHVDPTLCGLSDKLGYIHFWLLVRGSLGAILKRWHQSDWREGIKYRIRGCVVYFAV